MSEIIYPVSKASLEDMTLEELRTEKAMHCKLAKKYQTYIFGLDRQLYWRQENIDPINIAEEKAKYERGEMTSQQYATKCAQYAARIRQYKTKLKLIEYVDELRMYEKSLIQAVDEELEKRKSTKRRKGGKRRIDPRKRASRTNPKPGSYYATNPQPRKLKPLKGHSRYWAVIKEHDKSATKALLRRQEVTTWDYDKLRVAAQSIGYYNEESMIAATAQELGVSMNAAKTILKSGRMSWSQILLVGALFEMTPAVFCDVFLNGYFQEIAEGKYVAYLDEEDKEPLRVEPTPIRKRGTDDAATEVTSQDLQAEDEESEV